MADPADVGGKFWEDKAGPASEFAAGNMNRMRPPGHVHASDLLEVTVAPARWFNDTDFLTFPGAALAVPASTTTFVYLDGNEADGDPAQLKVTFIAFPSPTTKGLLYLAEVVTNSSEIVGVTNVNTRRPVAGSGVVQTVSATAPLAVGGTAIDPVISLPASGAGQDGYMSAANFSKLAELDYATEGDLLQGKVGGGGPVALALGAALSRLQVNAAGTALEYLSDPYPPSFYAEDSATASTTSTSPVLVPSMTLTPPAGTYLAAWGGSTVMNDANFSAFLSIFVDGVFQAGSERHVGSIVTPQAFLCFAKVVVDGSQAIEGRAVVSGAGGEVFVDRRNIIAFRIAP